MKGCSGRLRRNRAGCPRSGGFPDVRVLACFSMNECGKDSTSDPEAYCGLV
jgi:hypothetical protein